MSNTMTIIHTCDKLTEQLEAKKQEVKELKMKEFQTYLKISELQKEHANIKHEVSAKIREVDNIEYIISQINHLTGSPTVIDLTR